MVPNMNVSNLATFIGDIQLSMIRHGEQAMERINEKLPPQYHISVDMTGAMIGEHFEQLSDDLKETLTSMSLLSLEEVNEMLTDITRIRKEGRGERTQCEETVNTAMTTFASVSLLVGFFFVMVFVFKTTGSGDAITGVMYNFMVETVHYFQRVFDWFTTTKPAPK